ncbi:hypothetical protein DXG01_009652, partial [Tephrocybe rancida]
RHCQAYAVGALNTAAPNLSNQAPADLLSVHSPAQRWQALASFLVHTVPIGCASPLATWDSLLLVLINWMAAFIILRLRSWCVTRPATPATPPERSINDQLKDIILQSALVASSGLSLTSPFDVTATPLSPTKCKLAPADAEASLSMPSPTKKRAMEDTPVGSAVLQALAGLSANNPDATPLKRSTRPQFPTEKAAAADASKHVIASGPKASSLTCVRVKPEPAEPSLAPPLVLKTESQIQPTARSNTPISLSSSGNDDDSMPPISR